MAERGLRDGLGQEARNVTHEAFRVLVVRTVVGVRVDDQLRIGDVLLQNPGIDGVDDHVAVAVHHQCRLLDIPEVLIGSGTLHAPLADRLDLGGRDLLVLLGIAVPGPALESLHELTARGLARFRLGEMNFQPELIWRMVGRAENPLRFRREGCHALSAARPRADQNEAPHETRGLKRDFLRHKAADGEAKHIDLRQSKCLDEANGVGAHFLERGRHFARAAGDAGVVEQDHLAFLRQPVGHRGVPMVHGAREVLVEYDRDAAGLAETTVGEADAVGFDELGWSGLMGMRGHDRYLSKVQAFIPPSTVRFAPVMYEDSGLATNATIAAISSTCPYRSSAVAAFCGTDHSPVPGFKSVSIGPGWTLLTVMPRLPTSLDSA